MGTVSIERSELISDMLDRRGIKHEVLNAKHHQREAEIVAQAGRKDAVTIATNMAGRGTDIVLGGNPDAMAWAKLQEEYPTRLEVPMDVWDNLVNEIEQREQTKPKATEWSRWAACTSSAPNATTRGESTCNFADVAVVKATREAPASTFRWKTT